MKTLLLVLALFGATQFVSAQARRQSRPTPPPPPAAPPRPVAPPPAQQVTIGVDEVGKFEGRTYVNNALGFALTMPEGWQSQDSDVQRQIAERASDRTRELKTPDGRGYDDSIRRTKILLITVKPTDTRSNPSVVVMSEDIRAALNVRTPKQYIEQMRMLVSTNSDLPVKFVNEPVAKHIAGADFVTIEAGPRNPQGVPTFAQQYMVTLRSNRALVFILTYDGSPEQLLDCQAVIETLSFQ